MAYFYNTDDGSGIAGEPSPQEIAAGRNRNPADTWNPDRETWDEFCKRIDG